MLSYLNVGRQPVLPQNATVKHQPLAATVHTSSAPALRFGMEHDVVTLGQPAPNSLAQAERKFRFEQTVLTNDHQAFYQLVQQGQVPLTKESLQWVAECGKPVLLTRLLEDIPERLPTEEQSKLSSLAHRQSNRIFKLNDSIGLTGWLFPSWNPQYRKDMAWKMVRSGFSPHEEEVAKKREMLALLQTQAIDAQEASAMLKTALTRGHSELAEALFKFPGVRNNPAAWCDGLPINDAIKANNRLLLGTVLAFTNIDVNHPGPDSKTLLNTAIEARKTESVKALLDAPGIDVNQRNRREFNHRLNLKTSFSPMETAILYHSYDAIPLLLQNPGLKLDHRDLHTLAQSTNLHKIAFEIYPYGTPDVPARKARLKATEEQAHLNAFNHFSRRINNFVNTRDDSGNTILHSATIGGNTPLIEQLLQTPGIDPLAVNSFKQNGLHLALQGYNRSVAHRFLDIFGQRTLPNGRLIVNQKDNRSKTVLHDAAQLGETSIVHRLLRIPGLDVHPKNSSGKPPAELAAENCHRSLAYTLLDRPGIDPAARRRILDRFYADDEAEAAEERNRASQATYD